MLLGYRQNGIRVGSAEAVIVKLFLHSLQLCRGEVSLEIQPRAG